MPRMPRDRSESGIYHVMLRGANKQEIFHDDEDRLRFLETMDRYKQISKIEVYGWCLMDNHVHLLLKEGTEELAVTMKRIGVSFAWYYNWKYKTTGHLFQDRYRSEKVENDEYIMAVVRYIHQNPVKAGMVNSVEEWKWSSCSRYYGLTGYPEGLLDSEILFGMISENRQIAIDNFMEYNKEENVDTYLDDVARKRLTDEEARSRIKELIEEYEIAEVKSLPKSQRDKIIKRVKHIEGLSQRQAARILGLSQNLLFKG